MFIPLIFFVSWVARRCLSRSERRSRVAKGDRIAIYVAHIEGDNLFKTLRWGILSAISKSLGEDTVEVRPANVTPLLRGEASPIEASAAIAEQGRSFLAQLRGEKGAPRDWLYCWYNPAGGAIAKAEFTHDANFKLYTDGRFYKVAKDDNEK